VKGIEPALEVLFLFLVFLAVLDFRSFDDSGPAARRWLIAQLGAGAALFLVILLSQTVFVDNFYLAVALAMLGFASFPIFIIGSIGMARERGERLNLTDAGGFPHRFLEGEAGGARARLRVSLVAGRGSGPMSDELQAETDVPAPAGLCVSAEFVDPRNKNEPAFFRTRLDGLLGGGGVHWRDLRRAEGAPAWGENWRFWENSPGQAARVFGRASPPMLRELRLSAVGVRGGVLRCMFAGTYVGRRDMTEAGEWTRSLAAKLVF
jgi:hypothetical protein